MAQTQLFKDLRGAIKNVKKSHPWSLLVNAIPYVEGKHQHNMRQGTINSTKTVRLYYPIVKAAWKYAGAEPLQGDYPFRMVKKQTVTASGLSELYILESGLPDGSSLDNM